VTLGELGRQGDCLARIRKGAVIERVPVLLVPIAIIGGRKTPELDGYFYEWNAKYVAITLGYGSIYNHSYEPNARYVYGPNQMTYRALRDIAAGEEITVNYNYDPADKAPMRFKVV